MAKSKLKKKKSLKKKNSLKSKKNTKRNYKKKTITNNSKNTISKTNKKVLNSNKKTSNKKKKSSKNNLKTKNNKKFSINKKNKLIKYSIILFSICMIIYILFYLYSNVYIAPTPIVKESYIDSNNYINIKFKLDTNRYRNKIYCLFSSSDIYPSIDDGRWYLSFNNNCIQKLNDNTRYYTYFKNEDNIIFRNDKSNNLGKILDLKLSKNKVYLPLNSSISIKSEYSSIGYINEDIKWISDDNIVNVNEGKISSKSVGKTLVHASIMNKTSDIEVIVTDLITTRPDGYFDYEKGYLPCNKYSKEDNDLLDEILKDRINEKGYKTRAGVVEAARFLTLDFPYRINYFYENGRQTTNNVDGEGRYYHVGLYLNSSRNKNITGSKRGPETWGCSLYSVPAKRNIDNGLDCSGFVSWALLNGGFDVKDVGAGWSDRSDLTDFGNVKRLTTSLATSNEIKVGDLLHSEKAGGHIGIIVGIDNNYYYIAQALWYNEIGVIVTRRKKSELPKEFPHVVLMDDYYKNDGNLTNMW